MINHQKVVFDLRERMFYNNWMRKKKIAWLISWLMDSTALNGTISGSKA